MNTLKNVKMSSGRQLNKVVLSWQDFDCVMTARDKTEKLDLWKQNMFLFLSKRIKPNNDLIT